MIDWPRRPRLELVEANAELRSDLARALTALGFEVEAVAEASWPGDRDEQARYALHVIDLAAPGASRWLDDPAAAARCLFLAGEAVDAQGLDVLNKPFSIQLLEATLLRRIEAQRAPDRLRADPLLQTRDPRLARSFERAFRVARQECPVCIEGELGTGRRALARAMHASSSRAAEVLLTLEISSLGIRAGESIEQELARVVSSAGVGALLVVEPAALPARVQAALQAELRRSDDGNAPRCITIARRSLDESAREGRLSAELLYRLSGATFQLPPLRDRGADQLALCTAISRRVARELGLASPVLDPALIERLAQEGFAGNQPGLESRLRSAMIRGSEAGSFESFLFESVKSSPALAERPPSLDLKLLERDTIVRALGHAKGNRTHASYALGISVRTLRNKIRDYDLR